jgi:hypothetical protein
MAKVFEIKSSAARLNCGIQDLLTKADFSDAEVDAIETLDIGQAWRPAGREFTVTRLADSPLENIPGRRWFERKDVLHRTPRQRRNTPR